MRLGHALFAAAAVALTTAVGVAAQTPPGKMATPGEIRAFADALETCKTSTAATPHPFMRGFVIQHSVSGEQDGACRYAQTMPGNMTMECGFTAAGRKSMAAELRNSANGGPMSGGTGREQPAWAAECELVTATGSRSPMIQPRRKP